MKRARSIATAATVLFAAAGWLRWGPGWSALTVGELAGAAGEFGFTLLVYAPLALIAWIGGTAAGIPVARLGSRRLRALLAGGILGLSGLLLAVSYAALAGTLGMGMGGAAQVALLPGAVAILFQVTAEEWLFRGLLQPLAAWLTGTMGGILFGAAAFAAMHAVAGADGAMPLVNMLLGGLLFGMLAARYDGVAAPIAAHGAWNAAEQLGLGLDPNPGRGGFGALVDLDLEGATRWGGSADGLNGSWAMAFALAALVVPLAMTWRETRPARGRQSGETLEP